MTAPSGTRSAPYAVATYVGTSLFLALGSFFTVIWLHDSYLWLLLSGGLAALGLLVAYMSGSRAAVIAVFAILSVAFWVALGTVFNIEVFESLLPQGYTPVP